MAKNRLKEFGAVISSLERGDLSPLYCFCGEEEYLRRTAAQSVLKKTYNMFNKDDVAVQKLFGDEIEPENLENILVSYSLFAQKNVVIIRDAKKLKSTSWEVIDRFIESPPDTCVLILDDEKLDGRNSSVKCIKEKGWYFEFPELNDVERPDWIRRYAVKIGLTIDDDATEYLSETVEPRLLHYIQEFEKIQLFLEDRSNITRDDVVEITKSTKSFDIFEFINSMSSGKRRKTLKLLDNIFVFNESVPGVIVLIVRQLMTMLKVKAVDKGRQPGKEELQKSGLTWYHYNRVKPTVERLSVENIQDLLEAALEADLNLKTGYQSDKIVLTLLVQKFLSILHVSKKAG